MRKHIKMTFRGRFTGTPEIWSFGMKWQSVFDGNPDQTVGDIDQSGVTQAVFDFFQSGAGIPQNVKCDDWRAYNIGENGVMVGNPLVVDVSGTGAPTGTTTVRYPPQIALCATLVGSNRGAGRFGRFYLPTAQSMESSDSRLSASNAAGVGDAVTQFLKDISDAMGSPLGLSSACINVATDQASTWQIVDHVEVGRVFDTLRSRRGAMLEERVADGQIDW